MLHYVLKSIYSLATRFRELEESRFRCANARLSQTNFGLMYLLLSNNGPAELKCHELLY
jgi:hypothetical protein